MTTVSVAETAESRELHGFWTRSRKVGVVLIVLGLATVLGAFATVGSGTTAEMMLDKTADTFGWDATWAVPARLAIVLLAVVATGAGIFLATGAPRYFTTATVIGFAAFVLALLVWAVSSAKGDDPLKIEFVLAGALFAALPLIFGALAGVLCERSGVINVGIEGQLLAGAFCGALFATMTGNVWVGLVTAAVAGSLVTTLLGALAVRFQVDQVVLGVILNLLVLGVTGYLFDQVMKEDASTFNDPPDAPEWAVPLLSKIPVIGPMLFDQSIFGYVAIILVFAIWFLLFMTPWGLRTRAVGEHPQAADTLGVKVNLLRFRNVAMAGLVAGFGGAVFTIGDGLGFAKNMTVGKGFIALAVLIVGRWHPLGALLGALLFGFADQIGQFLRVIGSPVPSSFLSMLPYLVTIVAVAGLIGKVRAPAADGKPYIRS
ncbi:ABC transporter permease [Stackebrandtia nassauensis]|uniref:Inner-membrane translocator n=1 Tax=Stackebrandtia nassauensis (strain DSM 44728 / CIP 108903 / NRRL B-16338 / NBRC 102104 / LLR-40K-21) TaxID=446470 RepID=D3PUB7_STANL|nr:ABC transporter permease [Stackebrandtia nassauensis]ADD41063.1 inner-membrane translocator [Stackebrandtia nassauensis DSM 44728]